MPWSLSNFIALLCDTVLRYGGNSQDQCQTKPRIFFLVDHLILCSWTPNLLDENKSCMDALLSTSGVSKVWPEFKKVTNLGFQ